MFSSRYDVPDVMLKDVARLSIARKVYVSSNGSMKNLKRHVVSRLYIIVTA